VTEPAKPSPIDPPPDRRRVSRLALAAFIVSLLSAVIAATLAVCRYHHFRDPCACGSAVAVCYMLAFLLYPATWSVGAMLGAAALWRLYKHQAEMKGAWYALSGLFLPLLVMLVFAACLNGFMTISYSCPSAEARENLKAIFTAIKSKSADLNGAYPIHLSETNFEPHKGHRYAYFYRDDVIQPEKPGHGPYSRSDFPKELFQYLEECKDRAFVAFAIGRARGDTNLDVWAIDNHNMLVNIYDGRCDEPWKPDRHPCLQVPGR
jgi:hypothetical protein